MGPGQPPCVRASVWCLLLTPPTAAAPPGCGRFTRDPTRAITPWAGASSPGPLSAPRASPPVVQPRRPLGPVAVVATAKGQHCRRIPASSLSLLSLAFIERTVCSTSAASPAWKGPFLPRGLGEGSMCSPVLTLCAVWGQANRLSCGVIQCQTWSWEGLVTPQDLRVWAGRGAAASSAEQPGGPQLPQSPVAGAGLWPWRRLGQEPHCFKPLVPTQLPNPLSMSGCRGGQLNMGRAGHTRAHAHAHTHTAGPGTSAHSGPDPVTGAGPLHWASSGSGLGAGER